MQNAGEITRGATLALRSASLYASTAARVMARGWPPSFRPQGTARPHIFVCGSPRSGTTFVARALAAQPGLVDLGEVKPLKAEIPRLAELPEAAAALRLRRIVDRVRALACMRHLASVEQTPETAFVLGAALAAYPESRAVHALRDGRDVVCSLLERGWLRVGGAGHDDARQPYGAYARFWVEPGRRDEFERASDARRAAWAWRRYVTAARRIEERVFVLRYEELAADPEATAERLAAFLGLDPAVLQTSLSRVHDRSIGRWRRELTEEQLADVEAEAGPLLRELGYA